MCYFPIVCLINFIHNRLKECLKIFIIGQDTGKNCRYFSQSNIGKRKHYGITFIIQKIIINRVSDPTKNICCSKRDNQALWYLLFFFDKRLCEIIGKEKDLFICLLFG